MQIVPGCAALIAALWGSVTLGQNPGANRAPDSSRWVSLDTVVVTPSRSPGATRTSTVAVTTLSGDRLRRLPVRSVVGALAVTPGVAVVDVNSMGGNPRVIVRGFYGGGETDYLPALLDGVPIAALGSGAVDWDMLPRLGVSRLEVVRGGSSYIRGDAAIAGALNLLTEPGLSSPSWRIAGGSRQSRDVSLFAGHATDEEGASLNFDGLASDGFRAHEQRKASTVNADYTRYVGGGALTLFGFAHGRHFDDPGPLPSTITDRRASNPFFRFDRAVENVERGGIQFRQVTRARLSGYLVGEYASARTVKTLPLSSDFADTKLRRTTSPRALASTQVELGGDSIGWRGRLVAGVDGSVGRFGSRYADVASGTITDYSTADGAPGPSGPRSTATRQTAAGFAYWQVRPVTPLRLSLSTRFDHLRDVRTPDPTTGETRVAASHDALTPRLALNLALRVSDTRTNVYVSAGRVFKAPTLDQLFDDRAIPIPFPPFSTTISNAALDPQRGTALEGGVYASRVIGGARLDLSGATYHERMRDELDFDVNTFRYVNIGRSLHQGVEVGSALSLPSGSLLFANFSRQRVIAESGQFEGRQLKAIPRSLASAGADLRLWRALSGGLVVSSVGGAFVDDANAVPLNGYMRVDLRIGVPISGVRLTFDALNVLGRKYDATAFPDPAGSAVTYRYPAAGRVFVMGLESR
jgi:outer membrane receptor protein involved in Fe transport